jgi:subtilase family serine protease
MACSYQLCGLVEPLESRCLFAAAPIVLPDSGLTPAILQNVYGFNDVSFTNKLGKPVATNGAGQTIAIVIPYSIPTIVHDLILFDRAFGLPNAAAKGGFALSVVRPQGPTPRVPSWAQEGTLDVEWAHAIAPKARIVLVEARSSSPQDLVKAVDYARKRRGVTVVSMSFGYDTAPPNAADFVADFATPPNHIGGLSKGDGVSFVMAGGDDGALSAFPDASVPVVSVGGTLLQLDAFGNYVGESVQQGDSQSSLVGYAAAGNTGFDIYFSQSFNGKKGWQTVQGTSVGTPQWAGLLAIADQGRALLGKHSLDEITQTIPALSTLLPDSDFHVVTNGGASTGRGSPFADKVIPGLVAL